jgi:hypothetical protein
MLKSMRTSSKLLENSFSNQNERVIRNLVSGLVEAQKSIAVILSEFQTPISLHDSQKIVENTLLRFHLVVREICERHENRLPFLMNDEYDVQDLLEGLLRLHFDDVRREVPTTEFAGSSTRIDFLLAQEQIGIEAKRSRKKLNAKELGKELINDIAHYKEHPDCRVLYFFVYDPEEYITNPRGIERDLSKRHGRMEVNVLMVPKRV